MIVNACCSTKLYLFIFSVLTDDTNMYYECHFPACTNMEKELREFSICGRCQEVRSVLIADVVLMHQIMGEGEGDNLDYMLSGYRIDGVLNFVHMHLLTYTSAGTFAYANNL